MNSKNDGKNVSIGGFDKSSYWAKRKARKAAADKAVEDANKSDKEIQSETRNN